MAKLKNLSVGRAEQGVGVRIERTSTGLETTIEEGCEVGIYVKVGFGNFVEAVHVSISFARYGPIWETDFTPKTSE